MACVGADMRYEVRAQEPVLVQPLSEESHAPCFLSIIDQSVAPFSVDIVFVFDAKNNATRHGVDVDVDPAKVLKEALRKVLVLFYPVAGRLGLSPDHDNLFIECNAQGVSFVEADADIEISELGDLSQMHDAAATLRPLIFPLPSTDDRPLLTTQVTRFKCGGFVLGVVFQHSLFDGFALGEFVNAWAATARGEPLPTPPVLDRSILSARSPLQIKYPHMEFLEMKDLCSTYDESNMIMRSYCFSRASLERLRKKAMEDGVVSKCTTFEALSGLIWRARTRAMWSSSDQQPEQKVKLLLVVNGRRRMRELGAVPDGYVGNVVLVAGAVASVEELEEKPLSHAVKHVQDAIGRMTEEYMRSQIDFMECNKRALATGTNPMAGGTFGITSWSNLPLYTPNFGWGTPKHVGPVSLITNFSTVFVPYGLDNKGIHAVLALPPMVIHKFEELLDPYFSL